MSTPQSEIEELLQQVADENQIELRENMPQAVIDAPWHAMVLFDTFAGQECRQGKRTGARGGRAHEEVDINCLLCFRVIDPHRLAQLKAPQ